MTTCRIVAVMNGLARYLGCAARLESLDGSLKKQNPEPPSEAKVENFDEMARALSRLDRFNLTRTPNFEPRRGAAVPGLCHRAQAPLLYMPVRGPRSAVRAWLAALDGVPRNRCRRSSTRRRAAALDAASRGHRSFTVLRHPVARAHAVFCGRILVPGRGTFARYPQDAAQRLQAADSGGRPGPGMTATRIARPSWRSWVPARQPRRADGYPRGCPLGHAGGGGGDGAIRRARQRSFARRRWRTASRRWPPVGPCPAADARRTRAPDTPFALADIYDARSRSWRARSISATT